VQNLIQRFRRCGRRRTALEGVWEYWNRTLGAVNVDTPDPAVNVMANGWLLYQTLSCRLWGRTGSINPAAPSASATNCRTSMALVHAEPALTREHLLRAAAPVPRRRCAALVASPGGARRADAFFRRLSVAALRDLPLRQTVADTGVLDEMVPFLEARPVKPDEEAYYDLAEPLRGVGHALSTLRARHRNGLKFGEHGLPLMGCGDWNDGMNLVGKDGRGESVWLAFFLYDVLTRFAPLARARTRIMISPNAASPGARELQQNIEKNAWDGEWYRRAYFDNGEPLGSQTNRNARSIPCRKAGRSSAAPAIRPAHARRWNPWTSAWSAAMPVDSTVRSALRQIPAQSGLHQRPTFPACARTAANTPTPRSGPPWPSPHGRKRTRMGTVHAAQSRPPRRNSRTIATYKVEPYVVAADVYAVAPHTGRGGWTWYTGSASWMYRLLVETLLGVNLEGDQLRLDPRLPEAWDSYKIHYRYRQTVYHITITGD
jgi:cyclic beta-1,2-glucan synthetase